MEPKLELFVPKRRRFYRIPVLHWVSDSGLATNETKRGLLILSLQASRRLTKLQRRYKP